MAMSFSFALDYATKEVKKYQLGLKFDWTHQLLVYADDVNLVVVV
jgi:hypothetical protein